MIMKSLASPTTDERAGAATAQAILEAATDLFARDGYTATSVRAIAQAANANLALVSYYFGSKEGLYLAVLRELARQELAGHPFPKAALLAAQAGSDDATQKAALREVIHTVFARMVAARDRVPLGVMLTRELAAPTPALDRMIEEVARPQLAMLRTLIGRIIDAAPDSDEAWRAAFSLAGQVMYYTFARPLMDRLAPDATQGREAIAACAEQIAEFSWGGLMALRRISQASASRTHRPRRQGEGSKSPKSPVALRKKENLR
ncbi:hypothetical protein IP84_07680 [beta proteobacterium AAP99]|nr:hypothetical protein IP84_07680 [beta proteobacterium AAP99]